jgi:outer membrane protein TolC
MYMIKQLRLLVLGGICLTGLMPPEAKAQTTLTIQDCYSLAKANYPLLKQRDLITKSKEYTVQNASKGYLPQLSINGSATYQSEVTAIPISIPGMNVPTLSKDQYKLYAEVNQTAYDGGDHQTTETNT